ncbi:peptidoglycan-binding protein [Nesterenkonia sandarakina]|uniref:Peptidoglycan hydrolase-like protein with peptidoglycan-binding domain n=1 Tax=Nesterenkonia sandarakina TaxID=272918 RepID=A0A7Z0J4S1_9MICC|nr:peptidoglycan hydrolase-like protein with peptidoglycan-binding domain [Nesterenkonia sandarakina]
MIGINQFSGIVRQVNPGQRQNGDIAYLVDNKAVRIIESEEPFWRDLTTGTTGADVEAVQSFLSTEGYLEAEPSGTYDSTTAQAVTAWQSDLGVPTGDGAIQLGEIVAVDRTPLAIELGEQIQVGSQLSGGEEAMTATTGDREFVLNVTSEQARQIPADSTVEITHGEHRFEAVVDEVAESGSEGAGGLVEYSLTSPTQDRICGEYCDTLPAGEEITLRSSVIVSPPVEGVSVPAAAVRTDTDGATYVSSPDGDILVEVIGSGQGLVILEGLEEGTPVKVFASSTPGVSSDSSGPGEQ